jgi:hypothetical protein
MGLFRVDSELNSRRARSFWDGKMWLTSMCKINKFFTSAHKKLTISKTEAGFQTKK